MMKMIIFLCIFLFRVFVFSLELAITVDDLPASGIQSSEHSRIDLAMEMINSFKVHKVLKVYGFVNGILVENMSEREKILKKWKESGYLIGNHTYKHLDLSFVSFNDFMTDIEKNESFLVDYATSISELKVFRFPFLQEGDSPEKRYAIRSYLKKRNYKIAQVTVDFEDWRWGEPYIRCLAKKNFTEIKIIEKLYLESAIARLHFSDHLAQKIYGQLKPIKHILLLHLTPFTAHMTGRLLSDLKKEGVKFISSDEAINDPLFEEDSTFIGKTGKTFLVQNLETRKINISPMTQPKIPSEVLDLTCVD